MEKEKKIRKILMKALIGFPVSVTLLIIAYASIYFMAGEDLFNTELYQLHNINTLLSQIVSVGISGYLLAIFYIFSLLQYMKTEPYKITISSVVSLAISSIFTFCIIPMTLNNTKIFSENISTLNLTILVIVYALIGLIFCIKNGIERHLVKKINQKLSERNNK